MTCPATSSDTISRVRSDIDAFDGINISAANGETVSDLLRRAAGMQSWLSASRALLISRADALANPEPPPITPPNPGPGPDRDPNRDSGSDDDDTEPDMTEPGPEPAGPSAQDQLTNESNMSERQARQERRRAELLELLPGFHRALTSNQITAEHIDVIADLLDKAIRTETDEFIELADDTALELVAAQQTVEAFTATVKAVLTGLRSETPEERLSRQRAMSYLRIWDNEHGMTVINGEFDPETGNRIREVIDSDLKTLWAAHSDKLFPIPDGVPDKKKAAWLRAQALLLRLTQSDTTSNSVSPGPADNDPANSTPDKRPASPGLVLGSPAEIVLFADYDKLASTLSSVLGEPCGHFADGTAVGAATIRRLACDAAVLPMIFKADGERIDNARRARTANRSQRRALQKLYGGCMFCNAPFNWCQIHHFWHWLDGGPSDLWNLGPVCTHHHHQIHDHDHAITRNGDGTLNLVTATGAIVLTTEVGHPRPPVDLDLDSRGHANSSGKTRAPAAAQTANGSKSRTSSEAAGDDHRLADTVTWVDKARSGQPRSSTRPPNRTLF